MRATSVILWSEELHHEPRKILMMEDMLPDIMAAAMRNPPREMKVEDLLLPNPALQVAQYNTALLMLVYSLPREFQGIQEGKTRAGTREMLTRTLVDS